MAEKKRKDISESTYKVIGGLKSVLVELKSVEDDLLGVALNVSDLGESAFLFTTARLCVPALL